MRLLIFLLKSKLLNLKRRYKSLFTLCAHICLLFVAISYASVYSGVLNYFFTFHQENNLSSLLRIFNYVFLTLPLVLLFIPFYKPEIVFFQKKDPVSFTRRTVLEITNQLLSSMFLLQAIIILILYLYARPVSWRQVAVWIELVVLSGIMRLIIQAIINLRSQTSIIIALPIVIILIATFISYQHITLIVAMLIAIAAAIIFYHLLQYIRGQ